MKVVLFCGGMGLRLREHTVATPKPMMKIGDRPILWHLMKYYAHFGHTEFVLCLGWMGNVIEEYFVNNDEYTSNWKITFVDTGQNALVGERLKAVQPYLDGEDAFLANYSDGLSDLDLDLYLDYFRSRNKVATFLSVAAPHTFHIVRADAEDHVEKLEAVGRSVVRINGGFFAFKQAIFDQMRDGEDLVLEPFDRLMAKRELLAFPFDGFWRNMDTFKDRQDLEELWSHG